MLKYFNCPDGITRPITECLNHCPRPEGRCLSLPTLYEIGKTREWTSHPSTTQLLNPTRQEYLKITRDYAITPHEMAFALLGTRHHHRLEVVAKQLENLIAERKLEGEISGILDLLEPDDLCPDKWKLVDYKTWGSYTVAKHLSPTNGQYEKEQAILQLNHYRVKVEQLGFPVSRQIIQVTVRDGGTKTAKENNVFDRMLTIPIPIIDDFEVIEYFCYKADALVDAVNDNIMPEMCPYEERWAGRRCKGELCPVHIYCPEGAKINRVELQP